MADQSPETAVVITVPVPDGLEEQVLVRLPGIIMPHDITVDFRHGPHDVWTPSEFFEGSVEVRHHG
jgi:hypothetical protein